jgi:hypothetical protein
MRNLHLGSGDGASGCKARGRYGHGRWRQDDVLGGYYSPLFEKKSTDKERVRLEDPDLGRAVLTRKVLRQPSVYT